MYSGSSSTPTARERLYAALEAEHGSAYLLGLDLSLQYVNEGWRRFARENGAPELAIDFHVGRPATLFFDPALREFFGTRLRRALERNEPWSHIYECCSPIVYRKFSMRATPTMQRDGLIVVHSLVVEAKLGESAQVREDMVRAYTDTRGLIVQCSACGRVHNPTAASWNWAPGLVGPEREDVSHGICPTCDFQYYGQDDALV
jgi:hypothetical protein